MTWLTIPSLYYLIGLAWLLSGVATGWLDWRGHPAGVALWTITGAAIWPWFVIKILRDLSRGIHTTDLQ